MHIKHVGLEVVSSYIINSSTHVGSHDMYHEMLYTKVILPHKGDCTVNRKSVATPSHYCYKLISPKK